MTLQCRSGRRRCRTFFSLLCWARRAESNRGWRGTTARLCRNLLSGLECWLLWRRSAMCCCCRRHLLGVCHRFCCCCMQKRRLCGCLDIHDSCCWLICLECPTDALQRALQVLAVHQSAGHLSLQRQLVGNRRLQAPCVSGKIHLACNEAIWSHAC